MRTIRFAVPGWPGHLPGQRVDVRLTAEDGYRAERSYSIASPPETSAAEIELTVERLDDGEVSPYLADQLRPGDAIELRGPIGGYFVWSAAAARRPLLMLAGGSGVVPLMCMLRHRRLSAHRVPAALLYSCRTRADVIFHDELRGMAQNDASFSLHVTLTRDAAPGWPGPIGRLDLATVRAHIGRLGDSPDTYVCGSIDFVEAAAALALQAGLPAHRIRTERFGPSGARTRRTTDQSKSTPP